MKPYRTDRSKTEEVREMFDRIAPRYDLLNHTLSLGIDKLWRRRMVRIVRRFKPSHVIDVATGTGDLAIALARHVRGCRVLGVDLSEGMLDEARRKVTARGLDDRVVLDVGRAEELSAATGTFDAATVAFGVRNFGDLDEGLRRMAGVLREGGLLAVLEFSTPRNGMIRALYGWYAHRILPRIGGAVSSDRAAYEYLPASVDEFASPEEFLRIMERAGLRDCRARSLTLGVAHIYTGVK